MTSPLRIAFIGIDHPHGAAWRELLQNFGSRLEITAIVPDYNGGTTSLEERYANVSRYNRVCELIEQADFDGAVVCLPNDSAPQAIVQLAEAGKHILAEKPAAGSVEDAQKISTAVNRAGVAFQNGYMWRYDQGANRLREMVADGRFGKIISVEMTFVTSDVTQRGPQHYLFDQSVSQGGFFNWLACHFLDLLFYITAQKIVGVTARTGVFGQEDIAVEDGGVAILDLEQGGIATFLGGYWLPRWAGESQWCIRGSQRWVHWKPSAPGTGGMIEIHGPKPQWHAMEETFTIPKDHTPGYGGRNGMALVEDWIRSTREPTQPCRNTADSTQATLKLIETIYQSSAENRRIDCSIGSG